MNRQDYLPDIVLPVFLCVQVKVVGLKLNVDLVGAEGAHCLGNHLRRFALISACFPSMAMFFHS